MGFCKPLQLCLKDRDLMAGLPFEHQAVTELISDRCRFVLPIFSPNFLNSEDNKFVVNFSEALGIGKLFGYRTFLIAVLNKENCLLYRERLQENCPVCLPEL